MLGVIPHSTYRANMKPLRSDFYDFSKMEDELASTLIAKNIRRLLQKAPVLLARNNQKVENEMSRSCPVEGSNNWMENDDGRLFHSDSSLHSIGSTTSTDSSRSSIISLGSTIRDSLFKSKKARRKIGADTMIVLPRDMMNRLVRDVIRMSEGHELGIKGCLLHVEIEDEESGVAAILGKIKCDAKTEISNVIKIHLVANSTPTHAHASQVLLNRLLGSAKEHTYIKPGYSLEKCKIK